METNKEYQDVLSRAYVKENGELVKVENARMFANGFYAAMGYNGDREGDLFALFCGPTLQPCYDENGKRINVGADKRGLSLNRRFTWFDE